MSASLFDLHIKVEFKHVCPSFILAENLGHDTKNTQKHSDHYRLNQASQNAHLTQNSNT